MITDNDPAGMGIAFTNAVNRYTEHTCRLITTTEKYKTGYETDIHIPHIGDDDFEEVEQLLKDSDIFHFHVLRDENSHLGPLVIRDYIKGKKILHHHHGHPDFLINVDQYNRKYKKLNRKVVVSTPDLIKLAENSTWIPNLVPINDVQFLPLYDKFLDQKCIKICQSPTRKFHKNTKEFNSAISKVMERSNINIQPEIIENLSYVECLKKKRKCHIVFDHMRGWFGIASLESLSHGKPVIAGLDDWNIKCIKEFVNDSELPWVVARNEEVLKEIIFKLVEDSDFRKNVGYQSREFMEKHWTEKNVLKKLLGIYSTL